MAHFVLLLCSAWPAHPSHWSPPAHGSATVGADDRRHTHTEHAGQLLADCRRALEAWWSCANETLTLSKKDAARFQARLAHCAPRSQRPVRNSSAFVSWLPSMMKAVDANLLQQPPLPPRFVVLGGPACAAAFPPAPADPRPSTRKNKTGGGGGSGKISAISGPPNPAQAGLQCVRGVGCRGVFLAAHNGTMLHSFIHSFVAGHGAVSDESGVLWRAEVQTCAGDV